MYNFSAGRARLIPSGGTPYELGVIQSATVDLKVELKDLRGPYRYPIQVADGKGTASGKIMFHQIWPLTLAAITGGTNATGGVQAIVAEAGTITANIVTLAQGATMVVGSEIVTVAIGATNPNPVYYTRVTAGTEASATVAGQTGGKYSISGTGVMTFVATTDNTFKTQTTYLYTPAAGTNNASVALSQVGLNSGSTFQLTLLGNAAKNGFTNQAQQFIIQFNACIAPSLKIDLKLDDWTGLDLDFQAFIDVNGNLGTMYMVNSGG